MSFESELRKQMVLADDRETIQNIERDEQANMHRRHHIGDQIARVMSAQRVDTGNQEAQERASRARQHEAESAALSAEARDLRTAIGGFDGEVTGRHDDFELG